MSKTNETKKPIGANSKAEVQALELLTERQADVPADLAEFRELRGALDRYVKDGNGWALLGHVADALQASGGAFDKVTAAALYLRNELTTGRDPAAALADCRSDAAVEAVRELAMAFLAGLAQLEADVEVEG
jgi:hypothetical protein